MKSQIKKKKKNAGTNFPHLNIDKVIIIPTSTPTLPLSQGSFGAGGPRRSVKEKNSLALEASGFNPAVAQCTPSSGELCLPSGCTQVCEAGS